MRRLDDQRDGAAGRFDRGIDPRNDHAAALGLDQRLTGRWVDHPAQNRAFERGVERCDLEPIPGRTDARHQPRTQINAHCINQRIEILRSLQRQREAGHQGLRMGKPDPVSDQCAEDTGERGQS